MLFHFRISKGATACYLYDIGEITVEAETEVDAIRIYTLAYIIPNGHVENIIAHMMMAHRYSENPVVGIANKLCGKFEEMTDLDLIHVADECEYNGENAGFKHRLKNINDMDEEKYQQFFDENLDEILELINSISHNLIKVTKIDHILTDAMVKSARKQ